MKLKVVLGIIGVALICIGLVAMLGDGEIGCQEAPRYTEAQVITIAEKYLMATRDSRLPEECFWYMSKASYKGNGVWEVTVDRKARYSKEVPITNPYAMRKARHCGDIPQATVTFIFDEKTGALY